MSCKRKKFNLFLDNFPTHKTIKARSFCSENNIQTIFNVPYSPRYNSIEFYWSLVKAHFKRIRLGNIVSNKISDSRVLID
jgi:transposase